LGRFDVRAAVGGAIGQRSTHKGAPVSRRPPLVPLIVLCIAAASLLLAACGGSSPASNAPSTERSQEQKAEVKFADFAKCLREHGVNAEVGSPGGGGHGLKVSPGSGGPGQFEAAQKACARYRPEEKKVNLSPQEKVEHEEEVQKFAKCMREHGIKVEASTAGGGIQIRIHGHPGSEGGPNPESPTFQAAQKACQGLFPGPKGASKSGAPPGPGGASQDAGKGGAGASLGLQTGR
jgi:hypothetical protein